MVWVARFIIPLTQDITLSYFWAYDRLGNEDANSPIVTRRGSPNQKMMNSSLIHMILVGVLSIGTLFFVSWLIHLSLKNAAVVDVTWGFGFILLSAVYICQGQGFNLRNTIYFLMVLLWGIRIVFYLIKRMAHEKEEDNRYKKIRKNFGKMAWFKFLLMFELQAGLEMVIAIPFIIVSVDAAPSLS